MTGRVTMAAGMLVSATAVLPAAAAVVCRNSGRSSGVGIWETSLSVADA
jgi:hypothetical protein